MTYLQAIFRFEASLLSARGILGGRIRTCSLQTPRRLPHHTRPPRGRTRTKVYPDREWPSVHCVLPVRQCLFGDAAHRPRGRLFLPPADRG